MELVIRAYDPCVSCSAHMAEVKKAPKGDWKTKLNEIKEKGAPIFIGVGKRNQSDDGAGLELPIKLKKLGVNRILLESEIKEKNALGNECYHGPVIFIDAVDFNEKPGKIMVLPLQYIFSSSSLSHKFLPFLSVGINHEELKNSFVLGIQPKSIKEGNKISIPVRLAMRKIKGYLKNSSFYL